MERNEIKKAIHRSQHCQRNWDLSQTIKSEDMDVLMTAVTQCPSKQNVAFYRAHFITNRDVIEQIHANSDGFTVNYETGETTTNTQVLANLLVVFEGIDIEDASEKEPRRNMETKQVAENNGDRALAEKLLTRDKNMAIGIAAGYLNLTASIMGYSTGCCACFYEDGVQEILGLKNKPLLLMGIGLKNEDIGRRVHHLNKDFVFPTKVKQPIEVSVIP